MSGKLQFEHRQPNTDWQDSISNILLPFELAAQRAETHAESILGVVVGMSTDVPLPEYQIDALIHQASAIKNQMLDIQEMIAVTPKRGKS